MDPDYSVLAPEPWQALLDDVIYTFLPGVAAGILIAVILYFFFLYARRKRRKRRSIICIEGEHGDVMLSQRAVRDFVLNSLEEFRHTTVKHVYVTEERPGYAITVDLELAPGTQLRTEKDKMQGKVKDDLVDLAGLRKPTTVTLNVLSNDAEMRAKQIG